MLVAKADPRLRGLKHSCFTCKFVRNSKVAKADPRLRGLKHCDRVLIKREGPYVAKADPRLRGLKPKKKAYSLGGGKTGGCKSRSQIEGIETLPELRPHGVELRVAKADPRLRGLKPRALAVAICNLNCVAKADPRLRGLKPTWH